MAANAGSFLKRPVIGLPLASNFRRYKLGISYDGCRIKGGYSRNEDGTSVEDALLLSLKGFAGESNFANLRGSSRTDAGVHALRNVCQIDLRRIRSNGADDGAFSLKDVQNGINYYLLKAASSPAVVVTDVEEVDESFDARASAVSRTYMYRIALSPRRSVFHDQYAWFLEQPMNRNGLDITAMQGTANLLIGEKDFSFFRNAQCQSTSPYRNVMDIKIENKNLGLFDMADSFLMPDISSIITITITANAFLLKMCRNIVSILVMVGQKKLHLNDVPRLMESRDRHAFKYKPAPAGGLFLMNVNY